MRARPGGGFFIIQYFMHLFSPLKLVNLLPMPELSYNSCEAKCRGELCALAWPGSVVQCPVPAGGL